MQFYDYSTIILIPALVSYTFGDIVLHLYQTEQRIKNGIYTLKNEYIGVYREKRDKENWKKGIIGLTKNVTCYYLIKNHVIK